jgi:hypothetical protein
VLRVLHELPNNIVFHVILKMHIVDENPSSTNCVRCSKENVGERLDVLYFFSLARLKKFWDDIFRLPSIKS